MGIVTAANFGKVRSRSAEARKGHAYMIVHKRNRLRPKSMARFASYILMQLAPGTAKTAAEKISRIEGVKMAHAVTGPFDIIAFAEVPNLSALSDLVLAKIQNVKGVEKTQTAVVVTSDLLENSYSSNIDRPASKKKR